MFRVREIRDLVLSTEWAATVHDFARSLRSAGRRSGGVLLLGTPDAEPWHLAAHLDLETRLLGVPDLAPTLLRFSPPPGAPPHLSIGLERLVDTGSTDTLFVVSPGGSPGVVLERIHDARRRGATVLALETGDDELRGLAHEALTITDAAGPGSAPSAVPPWSGERGVAAEVAGMSAFETAQHLVSLVAADPTPSRRLHRPLRDWLRRGHAAAHLGGR